MLSIYIIHFMKECVVYQAISQQMTRALPVQWLPDLSWGIRNYLFRFWKSSGRWALVSLVLLLISCFFFFVLGLDEMPCTCAIALLCAVLVAGFIPFFWRSFSMSSISRGNSIPRNSCLRSSSTLMGTLGSFGYAMSSWESKFDSSQIWPAAFKD